MKLELSLLTTLAFFGMNTYAQDNAKTDKVLVAYFSWSGNTQHVAEYIAQQTGGTLFRIEPLKPYPEEYVPCTEVAKKKRKTIPVPQSRTGSRTGTAMIPSSSAAPMIINTFAESYDFKGKTVIPFCTYAETYRDETLARIVELTPEASHLKGFGAVDRRTAGIMDWLREIGMIK